MQTQGMRSTMNNNMYSNPNSSPATATKPPTSKWLPFRPSILEVLPSGRFPLHQKTSITPPIPEVALCPPQDQLLFSQVDEMERSFLDSAILRKIMDMNREDVRMVVSSNGVVTGARGQTLHVLKNEFKGKKQKKMRSSLGELMAMAYDEILVPVPLNTGKTDKRSCLRSCLQDHNYCPPVATNISPTTPGTSVQNR